MGTSARCLQRHGMHSGMWRIVCAGKQMARKALKVASACHCGGFDPAVLVSCLLSLVLHCNTLGAGFVYDDRRAILENGDVLQTTTLVQLISHDFWGVELNDAASHGSYRPLTVLSFRLTFAMVGLKAPVYHAANVALHCVVTALVVRLARRFLNGVGGVYLSGLLFAAHPVHCEAVAALVGRADLGATLFFLLGFAAYLVHVEEREKQHPHKGIRSEMNFRFNKSSASLAATLTLATASFLSKETGITLLPVCLLYDLIRTVDPIRRSRSGNFSLFKRISGSAVVSWCLLVGWALVLATLRMVATDFRTPEFATADNPAAKSTSWTTRTLTFLYLPVFHFLLLIWPRFLSFDWSMEAIRLVDSGSDIRNVATLIFYTTALCLARKAWVASGIRSVIPAQQVELPARISSVADDVIRLSERSTAAFLTLLMVLPFLPASNLLVYVGFVAAERILYLPSVGFCLLVGFGFQRCVIRTGRQSSSAGSRIILIAAVVVLITSLSVRTIVRNRDWSDEEHLYRSAITINPPKAYGNLGVVLQASGRLAEAEWSFRKALSHRTNMGDVHYNLGSLLRYQGRYEEALHAYNKAIACRPQLTVAYNEKAEVLLRLQRYDEAERTLLASQRATGVVRDVAAQQSAKVSTTLLLGDVYSSQGRHHDAISVFRRAAETVPWQQLPKNVFHLLATAYYRLDLIDEAEYWLVTSMEVKPSYIPAFLTYSTVLARNVSRIKEAEIWLLRAQQLAPRDPLVYKYLGEFLSQRLRYSEAADNLVKAAELEPDSVAAVVAAAHALHDARRNLEAEKYFLKAVQLNPNDVSHYVNLGAVLHVQGRFSEALGSYQNALRLQPDHSLALMNLQRLQSTWMARKTNQSCDTGRSNS